MKHLLWVSLVLLCSVAVAQDVKFTNAFEERVFEDFSNGKSNYVEMLVAASGRGSDDEVKFVKDKLNSIVEKLNPDRFNKYSSEKKVKKIFTVVQDELLSRYELKNQFIEVFETGKFNCVSSSAVYALILHHFNIPFEVIEEPGHVYIVATPENERIVIEGTDPNDGYIKLNERMLEKQLDALVSMKVITEEERSSESLGTILDELYPAESINFIQLVAIQYHNQAIYDYEEERYLDAYSNSLKADFLSTNPRHRAMAYSSLANYLSARDYYADDYPELFAAFADMDSSEIHISQVSDEFHNVCYKLMVDAGGASRMDTIYAYLKGISNARLRNELDFRYYYFKGLYLSKSGYIKEARPYLLNAVAEKSDHVEILSVLCSNIFSGADLGHFPNLPDTIRKYESEVPALKDFKLWQSGSANVLLSFCYNQMGQGEVGSAKRALRDFENLMDTNAGLDVSSNNIGVTYCRVALNDFKSSKVQALRVIDKGLKYAPGNTDLLRMRKVMN